jgi:hypothetical protein
MKLNRKNGSEREQERKGGDKKAIQTQGGKNILLSTSAVVMSLLQYTYITCLVMFLDTKQEDIDPELNGSKHCPSSSCF